MTAPELIGHEPERVLLENMLDRNRAALVATAGGFPKRMPTAGSCPR